MKVKKMGTKGTKTVENETDINSIPIICSGIRYKLTKINIVELSEKCKLYVVAEGFSSLSTHF